MYYDQEKADFINDAEFMFSEKSVRHGFLRKVYSLLFVQILVTSGVIAVFLSVPEVKEYVGSPRGSWLWITSFAGVIIFMLVLACVDRARRVWPTNIICLFGFTIFESITLGVVTCHYNTDTVLLAAFLTALVTLGLTIFAFQTKYDLTACAGTLFVCLFVFTGMGILMMFVPNKGVQILYSACGAGIFGLYLVFDTQMMIGGKHKYSISPEEYIFAALNLYLDIINLFLHILSILNQSSKN